MKVHLGNVSCKNKKNPIKALRGVGFLVKSLHTTFTHTSTHIQTPKTDDYGPAFCWTRKKIQPKEYKQRQENKLMKNKQKKNKNKKKPKKKKKQKKKKTKKKKQKKKKKKTKKKQKKNKKTNKQNKKKTKQKKQKQKNKDTKKKTKTKSKDVSQHYSCVSKILFVCFFFVVLFVSSILLD